MGLFHRGNTGGLSSIFSVTRTTLGFGRLLGMCLSCGQGPCLAFSTPTTGATALQGREGLQRGGLRRGTGNMEYRAPYPTPLCPFALLARRAPQSRAISTAPSITELIYDIRDCTGTRKGGRAQQGRGATWLPRCLEPRTALPPRKKRQSGEQHLIDACSIAGRRRRHLWRYLVVAASIRVELGAFLLKKLSLHHAAIPNSLVCQAG